MPRATGNQRSHRLARSIQRIVAEALQMRVSDPRLRDVALTEVRMSKDLQHATVLWTPLDGAASDERLADMAAGFEAASRMLRTVVAGQLRVRSAPELAFQFDRGLAHARRMQELLDSLDSREKQ